MLRTFRLIDAGVLSAVGLLAAACAESGAPTAPTAVFRTDLITCAAAVRAGTLSCASAQPSVAPQAGRASGMSLDRIFGGQGALVRLASSGTSYNSGTQIFSSNVTLENLIAQPMNTADGTTPDAGGIKVFFNSGPTVTGGTGGPVNVANSDGTGTFLGSSQQYFLYSDGAVLASGSTTSAKSWQFSVPATVTTFEFQVFVSTRLPDEVNPIVALGLSRSPAALTIAPGGSGTATVLLTRTNFTGAVSLSLDAPSGITGSFSPASATGTTSTLTVNVDNTVALGPYTLNVFGLSTAGTRATTLSLTVGTAGGSGNVTADFSGCPVAERAVWVGAQDGTNAWARITGSGDVYHFTIGSGGGGLAYVVVGAGGAATTTVQYRTQAEFTAGTLVFCAPPATGKTINGTVAGITATDLATISLGGSAATVFGFGSPDFQLSDVPNGAQDLVAARRDFSGVLSSVIIHRNQNPADNGSVGTLDFSGVDAFTPATATITLNGLLGGENVTQGMFYQVAANCATASLYSGGTAGASFTASGIPSGQQVSTDFHGLSVFASTTTGTRLLTEYFHTLANRTVTLGANMPTPTITTLAGPYERLQAAYTLPTDYEGATSFGYSDANSPNSHSVGIDATFGFLGGTATTLALPDFSGLSGFDVNWPPASSSTGTWTVSGTSTFTAACTEGADLKSASVNGTF